MIRVIDLDVYYGKEQVLKHINVTIKKREITALIGPSGCGKSTLLYSINRLLEERGGQARGSIMLDELDILSADPQAVRKKIGMVFQMPRLRQRPTGMMESFFYYCTFSSFIIIC